MIKYLKIGQIINTHGIKGEAKIYPLTDDVKRFDDLKYVYLKDKNEYLKMDVKGVKYIKDFPILKLQGFDSIEDVQKHKNAYIYIDRENSVKLEEDSYFIADLIGLEVFSLEGEKIGEVTSVFPTGSNDVYEVKTDDNKVILIPAIKDVIVSVNVKEGKMIIRLLEGLI